MARPLSVTRQPPLTRSISFCEKISRLGTRSPVSLYAQSTAGGQNGHVPLDFSYRREPVRIAHQDLEHCDLKNHLGNEIINLRT